MDDRLNREEPHSDKVDEDSLDFVETTSVNGTLDTVTADLGPGLGVNVTTTAAGVVVTVVSSP